MDNLQHFQISGELPLKPWTWFDYCLMTSFLGSLSVKKKLIDIDRILSNLSASRTEMFLVISNTIWLNSDVCSVVTHGVNFELFAAVHSRGQEPGYWCHL